MAARDFELLTPLQLRALVCDACDVTLTQARAQFTEAQALEAERPNDHYVATYVNLLDAIFYMRFGGQWRASAARHAFLPLPSGTFPQGRQRTLSAPSKPAPLLNSIVRHISRDLFR